MTRSFVCGIIYKTMTHQRRFFDEARQLRHEAIETLQPLHDELADMSGAFDGIVYFPVDYWHKDQANAAVSLRPDENNVERHQSFERDIHNRRVDLGATALGAALKQNEPQYLPSRMNPDHVTWAERVTVGQELVGGLQAAFRRDMGKVTDEKSMRELWNKYSRELQDVAQGFYGLSKKVDSLGDTMEMGSPTTPNSFVLGWDLVGSTGLARHNEGALRNLLLDTKEQTLGIAKSEYVVNHDDTGDGQHLVLWLPEDIDRANSRAVYDHLETSVKSLIEDIQAAHHRIAASYSDVNPEIRIAVGLAHSDRDRMGRATSPELWEISRTLKEYNSDKTAVAYTAAVQRLIASVVET